MRIIRPTPELVQWADLELGVIIHCDLEVFDESFTHEAQKHEDRDPRMFAPMEMDTDQWVRAAYEAGARYAVLVAKHCSGYCLWPTQEHDFCIRTSPWKNGRGDVVGDFFRSCEKYGLKPGLYYSASRNGYYRVDNGRITAESTVTQEEYNAIVLRQLTELWTNYGKVFEIWFDGGCVPVSEGGPDVAGLLQRLQPEAVVFQGPVGTRSLLRWVGNEDAAPDADCSATVYATDGFFHGSRDYLASGVQDGDLWAPAESDMPGREAGHAFLGGWFWRDGDDRWVFPRSLLFERYLGSVGHNSNLLVGMVIDNHGLVPRRDCEELAGLGVLVREAFAPEKRVDAVGDTISLGERPMQYAVIGEDIAEGERVTGFELWHNDTLVESGHVIGHKRIIRLNGLSGGTLTLKITAQKAEPLITTFAAY